MGNVHVVGPNEALVISGGCCGSSSKRVITGGYAWTCCLVSNIQKLTLEVFTLTPNCEKIESKKGVCLNVNAIAQCKIDKNRVATAAEMFLGKDLDYIKTVVLQTIEGHLRAITGTLEMEEIFLERQTFANSVTEMASKDLENFGVSLLSFTIKEIGDTVEYLTSMGRKDVAKIKNAAAIDVTKYETDFKIKEQEAELAIKEVELTNNRDIEEQNKNLKTEIAKQNCEANKKRTEAEMAYGLESVKIKQEIAKERKNVELAETKLKLAMLENELKEKEIEYYCDVILPAESEAYRLKIEGEANRYKKLEIAKAEAAKAKKLADAYSEVIKSNGEAQAEFLKNRASAFKLYNNNGAGLLQLTLAALPKITAEICAPFKNIDEIVLVNGPSNQQGTSLASNFSSEASRLASELPPVIKALTGINLTRGLDNIINIAPGHNYLPLNQQPQAPASNQSDSHSNTLRNFKTINDSKKVNNSSNRSIDSISLINNPQTVKSSSKMTGSNSSSISNLSKNSNKGSATKLNQLLNTKPKSVSNLSIHTVK